MYKIKILIFCLSFISSLFTNSLSQQRYEGKTINQWIEQLKTGGSSSQRSAVEALGKIGPPAREALPALLTTPLPNNSNFMDLMNRSLTISSIVDTSDTSAINAVVGALIIGSGQNVSIGGVQEGMDFSRLIAMTVLKDIGSQAVPALIKALSSSLVEGRKSAAVVLGEMGPNAKEAIPALRKALKDKNKDVRERASSALKKLIGK